MADKSLYGSDVRQEVQDPLAPRRGQPVQPNTVPLSGVEAPTRANFSQVGEGQRVIAKLLGDSAGLLDKYVESNRQQWELDGKMAYAQGTAEEDIRKAGNKYTMAGFLTMKTQVAANQFYEQELTDINDKYREANPEQYRQDLSARFKQMSQGLGNDPFVQRLLGAGAAETFPKLVAQQTKTNNAWREEQTVNSASDMIISGATLKDPQNPNGGKTAQELRDLTKTATDQITNPDLKKKVVANALRQTLEMGDLRYANAMAGTDTGNAAIQMRDLPPTQKLADSAVSTILRGEVSADGIVRIVPDGDGKAIGGINSESYPEQFAEASQILRDQGQAGVVQYLRNFYRIEIIEKNGVGSLSADVQDVVADGLTNHWYGFQQKLLEAAKNGTSREGLLAMRRDEYVRLAQANPAKYGANLDGWLQRLNKLNSDGFKANPVDGVAKSFATENMLRMSLVHNGFDPSEINGVMQSWNKAQTTSDNQFDKNRYINEQSILNTSQAEGNLPKQLDRIRQVQQQNGYSERWANQMAEKASTQVNEYDKKQTEFNRLDAAGNNGALSFESPEKQRTAIDRHRSAIVGTWAAKPGLSDDDKNAGIRKEMTDYLVRNGVVDSTWKKSINQGLSGNIVAKDGTIDPAAVKAYQDYKWLKQNAPVAYAQNYVEGDAKKLIAQAEALDLGQNSDKALLTAAQMLTANREGVEPRTVSQPNVAKIIDKKVEEEWNPGMFSFMSRFQAADAFDVKDSDIAAAKNNPSLKAFISAQASTILSSDTTGRTTPEAAVNQAWNDGVGRMELAPSGNVLISGKGKTIREEMGFPNANATNLVFKTLQEFAAYNGKAYFGPRYHGYTQDADKQFAMYKAAYPNAGTTGKDERWVFGKVRDEFGGVHPSNFVYDPDRKGIHWTLLKESDDGTMIPDGDSRFIPIDMLGDFARERKYAERSDRSLGDYIKNGMQDLKTQFFGKD